MLNIGSWADKWNICDEALDELYRFLWSFPTATKNGLNEAGVQSLVKLEASVKKCRLWRNNSGALPTPGGFMRFGLGNESEAINKQFKSSDLIGIRPVKITEEHLGKTIGQFLCREVKAGDWKYSATPREIAQKNFIDLINLMGGDAAFANGEGTI